MFSFAGIWSPPVDGYQSASMKFFADLANKLRARFPTPYPLEIKIFHHKCGGEVTERFGLSYDMNPEPNRAQCERATNSGGGCGGTWPDDVIEAATDEEVRAWFYARDEAVYLLKEQNQPVDEYGNAQPRAFLYLEKKK